VRETIINDVHSIHRVETQSIRDVAIGSIAILPHQAISSPMVVPVMRSTKWDSELVADLAPHRPGLGEPQMVGVSGASAADQTRLRCHELEVGLVAEPTHLADREHAFVDLGGSGAVLDVC
jgi:hypothetical protein